MGCRGLGFRDSVDELHLAATAFHSASGHTGRIDQPAPTSPGAAPPVRTGPIRNFFA